MEQQMRSGCRLTAVWIPSHCGLKEIEEADNQANLGVDQPLVQHQRVPLSEESAESILRLKPKGNLVTLCGIPDSLPVSNSRAEVILNQLITDCPPLTKAFFLEKAQSRLCSKCPNRAIDTVNHLILRCSGRATSRRRILPRQRNTTISKLCHENPYQVLEYLHNEELLAAPNP